jgi:hypothetical protein
MLPNTIGFFSGRLDLSNRLAVPGLRRAGPVHPKFALADIPEHLTREEDFIGFILYTIDLRAICQHPADGTVDGLQLAVNRASEGDGSILDDRHAAVAAIGERIKPSDLLDAFGHGPRSHVAACIYDLSYTPACDRIPTVAAVPRA